MKMKEFNAENSARLIPVGIAAVRVCRKTGLFSFSKAAVALMGLQDGERLSVIQDEETGKDWYFKRSDAGFVVRINTGDGNADFGSTRVARALLDSAKHTHETIAGASFQIKKVEIDGEPYYLILTVKPIREKAV